MTQSTITQKQNVIGILLAAGQGSRFGGHKLRYVLDNGIAMGLQSALNLKQVVDEVICIVRPDDKVLISEFEKNGLTVVENPNHNHGLSSSIYSGIQARPDADYWIIGLGDMPFIKASTYSSMQSKIANEGDKDKSAKQIIRPAMLQGLKLKSGHPVAFPNRYREALLTLTGDTGAASILKTEKKHVQSLMVEDSGIFLDIDEPPQSKV